MNFIPIIAIPKYIGFIVKVIVVVIIILVIVAVDDIAAGTVAATTSATAIEFIIFADVKVFVACKCLLSITFFFCCFVLFSRVVTIKKA